MFYSEKSLSYFPTQANSGTEASEETQERSPVTYCINQKIPLQTFSVGNVVGGGKFEKGSLYWKLQTCQELRFGFLEAKLQQE